MSKDIKVLNMQCMYLVPKVQNEQKRARIPNSDLDYKSIEKAVYVCCHKR